MLKVHNCKLLQTIKYKNYIRTELMHKKNYRFDFNCSKNQLIIDLDELKVINTNKSTNTDLLCRSLNNAKKINLKYKY